MPHIDATPFIQVAAPRGHRPRIGKHLRVRLVSSTVDVSTDAKITAWMGRGTRALSRGIVVDQLVAHAKRTAFKPAR